MLTELRQTAPGEFEAVEGTSPFSLAIGIEVPSDGHLVYTWTFGEPSGEPPVRIIGAVVLVR
jgi:hypothetical protein